MLVPALDLHAGGIVIETSNSTGNGWSFFPLQNRGSVFKSGWIEIYDGGFR